MTATTAVRRGHRPDRLPPPGWTRWRCNACSATYDEPTAIAEVRRCRCPDCWGQEPHWSRLVERADGATPCPDCQAPILWLTTEAGKRMPVDATPDPQRGNVIRQGASLRCGVLGRRMTAAARAAGVDLYLHHRLSCPHADRWATKGA